MAITSFTGKYDFLNNNFYSPIKYEGTAYLNAEAAFQAQKTTDRQLQKVFGYLPGDLAKYIGHKLTLPSSWDQDKISIMFCILMNKFHQNLRLLDLLVSTGNEEIIYVNEDGDDFWGVCNGIGKNTLGQILMKIREGYEIDVDYFDDALEDNFLYDRLVKAQDEHERLIIAYDIDDTVRPYKSKSCDMVKDLIRRAETLLNPYFIVFTANPHKEENIAFLEAEGLPYDAINENADFIGRYGEGLKIYYNLLLDDKAGLKEAYDALDRLCDDYEEMLF